MHDRYQLEREEQLGIVIREDRLLVPAAEYMDVMGRVKCTCLCHGQPEGTITHDRPCCIDGWAPIPENLCQQWQQFVADR